jgi:hypothetical protein
METRDSDEAPPPPPAENNVQKAWALTLIMVLAPLLMLITIWVLTLFRVNRP